MSEMSGKKEVERRFWKRVPQFVSSSAALILQKGRNGHPYREILLLLCHNNEPKKWVPSLPIPVNALIDNRKPWAGTHLFCPPMGAQE